MRAIKIENVTKSFGHLMREIDFERIKGMVFGRR